MDKEVLKLIEYWERLGWYDKKRICWISFWACYEIDTNLITSMIATMAIIAISIFEPHQRDKAGLLMAVGLLYFYTILIDYIYKRAYR